MAAERPHGTVSFEKFSRSRLLSPMLVTGERYRHVLKSRSSEAAACLVEELDCWGRSLPVCWICGSNTPRARTVVFPVRITVVSLSRGGRRPEREKMKSEVFNLVSEHRVVK